MADHLPLEIVEEILHRLPVKSLVKFTSVCRAWNSLITSQTFISDHLTRTIQSCNGNGSLLFQFYLQQGKGPNHQLHRSDLYSLYSLNQQTNQFFVERFPLSHLFRPDRYKVFAGTCNGLISSADYSTSESATILIWNPLLRKYVVLPKPIMTCTKRNRQHYDKYDLCFGFGFDSRNNDYKVIRLMNLSEQDTPHVEVYSLLSRSWRSITVRVPQFFVCYRNLAAMFANGLVHWVVGRRRHKFILSFDATEETFGKLKLPQIMRKYSVPRLLAVEGGHLLAVVNKFITKQNQWVYSIWVMKEYGITESWTEIFHCEQSRYGGISYILALTGCGKVVMRLASGAILLVDPVTEPVEHIGHQPYSEAYVGSYVESLFFINKEHDVLSF